MRKRIQEETPTPPRVPPRMARLLEGVLTGAATEDQVREALDLTEGELGILLRALIRQRSKDLWQGSD